MCSLLATIVLQCCRRQFLFCAVDLVAHFETAHAVSKLVCNLATINSHNAVSKLRKFQKARNIFTGFKFEINVP